MSRPPAAPRHVAMVDALDLAGSESVLEVGCGGGVAATLVCGRLTTGGYVGIDRSATQVAAAAKRNAGFASAAFVVTDLAGFDAGGRRFDRIFAMHVRALLAPADDSDLAVVRASLADGGSFHLGWEPFADADPMAVGSQQAAVLRDHGFEVAAVVVTGRTALVSACVR
jgi:cyclopropane fatty-acyl-phospholipid synthase-like methyltransferase